MLVLCTSCSAAHTGLTRLLNARGCRDLSVRRHICGMTTTRRGKRKADVLAADTETNLVVASATARITEADGSQARVTSVVAEQTVEDRVVYSASMRPAKHKGPAVRMLSWNVASLRTSLKQDAQAISRLVEAEEADIICLQETKLKDSDVEACERILRPTLPGWHFFWNSSVAKKGYSGVALLSRTEPLGVSNGLDVEEHDQEGRLITAEYPSFYVVNCYVPNSGEGLKRLEYRLKAWDVAFAAYLEGLSAKKPVILTGDLNCAHQEIDIHNPKKNLKSAGFTPEERESFARLLLGERGFRDVFRERHPGVVAYTYWNYRTASRAPNRGWRLDYFLVPEALVEKVDVYHLPDIMGSDHCPIGMVLKGFGEGNAEM